MAEDDGASLKGSVVFACAERTPACYLGGGALRIVTPDRLVVGLTGESWQKVDVAVP